MEILLFDLDGVLLNSAGYHRSLQETVRHLARGLGFGDRTLSRDDIELLEALDITAEWDSSAICAALLLIAARRVDPAAGLPRRPPILERPDLGLPFPEVQAFLRTIDRAESADPVEAARQAMLRHLDGSAPEVAREALALLADARHPGRSLTFWLIQLFNLGSERFQSIYSLNPGLQTESYLERYDLPTLTDEERAALRAWLNIPDRWAAIVTNRPSASSGVFHTPEAEIGTAAAGVADLPRIAAGDLGPAATARGLDPQAFLKPRPVHLLAGMLRALGVEAGEAVEAAIGLAEGADAPAVWSRLDGARVRVFEDAAKGLVGARAAARVLADHEVRIVLRLYGIAESEIRSQMLGEAGAQIFPHVREALRGAGVLRVAGTPDA